MTTDTPNRAVPPKEMLLVSVEFRTVDGRFHSALHFYFDLASVWAVNFYMAEESAASPGTNYTTAKVVESWAVSRDGGLADSRATRMVDKLVSYGFPRDEAMLAVEHAMYLAAEQDGV